MYVPLKYITERLMPSRLEDPGPLSPATLAVAGKVDLLNVPPGSATLTTGVAGVSVRVMLVVAGVNAELPGYDKLMPYGESRTVNELVSKLAKKLPVAL